jgi:[NiFe] hydrogenase assembly HybE family chaperone
MTGFEGSFLGNNDRIDAGTLLECSVCWWVYDPALGDATWQIPAGTAFAALPDDWRCPGCDAARDQFLVLEAAPGAGQRRGHPRGTPPGRALQQREQDLLAAYAAAAGRMQKLPVYNKCLDIQIVGLQHWNGQMLCIAATPWCMNILLLPGPGAAQRIEGTIREVEFPSGRYSFIAGELAGIGPLESCSLFSPMEQFDSPAVVQDVARHAMRELLRAPDGPALSRRRFLQGNRPNREQARPG